MTDRRIPESVLAEIRSRLSLERLVARRVKLAGAGGGWKKGLCPFHDEKSPSFTVKPAQGTFHCFGCGAHGDVIGWVRRIEGLAFPEAVRWCAQEAGLDTSNLARPVGAPWLRRPVEPTAAEPPGEAGQTPAERSAAAFRIWDAGAGIGAGSPQAHYLAGRGLWPLPAPAHAVLRAGSGRHQHTGDAVHPLLLARVDGPDGRFRAVHRTWLGQEHGRWTKLGGVGDPRRSFGVLLGGAIRLFPAAPRMGVAEGIETALAAHRLTGIPVWSCLNANGVSAVDLPFDVEDLVVFADRDRPRLRAEGFQGPEMPEGAGIYHARKLADRQRALAVKVEIRAPREMGDYADLWLQQRQAGAA